MATRPKRCGQVPQLNLAHGHVQPVHGPGLTLRD